MSAMTIDRRFVVATGASLALAGLLAAGITQFARGAWPFRTEAAAAEMPEHEALGLTAPRYVAEAGGAGHQHASDASALPPAQGHAGMPSGAQPPSGYAPVAIEPARLAALAIATAPVEDRDFVRPLRTVGVVALDETRTAHVHSKVRGWIDGITVNFVGKEVKGGDVLCSIYSQEVYAAEIELLAVLGQGGPVLEAARRRLALWDVPKSEVARLEATREPRRTFPLLAPRTGTVIAKQALQGMYVDASTELYTLTDLSHVWVLADVYESHVAQVREGGAARLSVEGVAGVVAADVSFLSPTLDEATRTRKVRFEVPNSGGQLLPGAFVTVELDVQYGRGLAVPESAVIRTGARSIVFVAHGEPAGHFEPREVTLGPLVGDFFRVDVGLTAGERVATTAQFLLDSESRLRASSTPGGAHAH